MFCLACVYVFDLTISTAHCSIISLYIHTMLVSLYKSVEKCIIIFPFFFFIPYRIPFHQHHHHRLSPSEWPSQRQYRPVRVVRRHAPPHPDHRIGNDAATRVDPSSPIRPPDKRCVRASTNKCLTINGWRRQALSVTVACSCPCTIHRILTGYRRRRICRVVAVG